MPDSQEPPSDPQADGGSPATPDDTPDQAPESPEPSESAQDTSSESASESSSESSSEIEADAGTVASQTETSSEPDKDSPSDKGPDLRRPEVQEALARYWKSNLSIMAVLLAIWAFVGLGCGILWADVLNEYTLPLSGIPLGFWFAQQGSIIVFVLLILVYCLLLNRLDRKHHEELVKLRSTGEG